MGGDRVMGISREKEGKGNACSNKEKSREVAGGEAGRREAEMSVQGEGRRLEKIRRRRGRRGEACRGRKWERRERNVKKGRGRRKWGREWSGSCRHETRK